MAEVTGLGGGPFQEKEEPGGLGRWWWQVEEQRERVGGSETARLPIQTLASVLTRDEKWGRNELTEDWGLGCQVCVWCAIFRVCFCVGRLGITAFSCDAWFSCSPSFSPASHILDELRDSAASRTSEQLFFFFFFSWR